MCNSLRKERVYDAAVLSRLVKAVIVVEEQSFAMQCDCLIHSV
jgi:hypothetical protein